MSVGYRGYIASRPVRGEMTPQHVQNLVVRDYADRNDLQFLLSATEYAMPRCFMMLDTAVDGLDEVEGIIFFSLFMMPDDGLRRRRIYHRALELGRSLHFALENLAFQEERDIDRLEDMFSVDVFAKKRLSADALSVETMCPVCGGAASSEAEVTFSGVTSDVKPWPRVPSLLVCGSCGLLHKRTSPEWFRDVDLIYKDYEAYHQGQGAEQSVRHEEGSELSPRSSLLVRFAKEKMHLPSSGRLLDIGCGNGALLRSFASEFPDWKMVGVDRSQSGADAVRGIPGVERFVLGGPADVPGSFDVVSLVHVLEHVTEPISFLYEIGAKLRPGGVILVDAPSYAANPFDLAVVDHVLHFSRGTLAELAHRAGYEIRAYASSLVRKEHVALLEPRSDSFHAAASLPPTDVAVSSIAFLQRLSNWLPRRFAAEKVAIFGTGIAATWAFEQLGGSACFVDEDPNRFGRPYLGVPVVAPPDVPTGIPVFIAQPPELARDIADRLATALPDQTWIPCPSTEELDG